MSELVQATLEHVLLVGVSIGVATLVGVPLGIALTRRTRWERLVLGIVSVVQTIPSLALFGFLIPVPWIGGIGTRSALVALTLYALLPVLRNTVTGIRGIDPAVREAGIGMGMTDGQLLWRVELPLAVPEIVAGLRIATVSTVAIATLAVFAGAGGLGAEIYNNITFKTGIVVAGGLAILIAIAFDVVLMIVQRWLTPWRRSVSA